MRLDFSTNYSSILTTLILDKHKRDKLQNQPLSSIETETSGMLQNRFVVLKSYISFTKDRRSRSNFSANTSSKYAFPINIFFVVQSYASAHQKCESKYNLKFTKEPFFLEVQ